MTVSTHAKAAVEAELPSQTQFVLETFIVVCWSSIALVCQIEYARLYSLLVVDWMRNSTPTYSWLPIVSARMRAIVDAPCGRGSDTMVGALQRADGVLIS